MLGDSMRVKNGDYSVKILLYSLSVVCHIYAHVQCLVLAMQWDFLAKIYESTKIGQSGDVNIE